MVDSEGGRLSRPDDDEEFEEAFGVLTAHAATTVREFAVGQPTPVPGTQASAAAVGRSGEAVGPSTPRPSPSETVGAVTEPAPPDARPQEPPPHDHTAHDQTAQEPPRSDPRPQEPPATEPPRPESPATEQAPQDPPTTELPVSELPPTGPSPSVSPSRSPARSRVGDPPGVPDRGWLGVGRRRPTRGAGPSRRRRCRGHERRFWGDTPCRQRRVGAADEGRAASPVRSSGRNNGSARRGGAL